MEISFLSESTILVVEAIRTLGKERIDSQVISILRGRIPEKEKEKLLCEASLRCILSGQFGCQIAGI